MGEPPLRRLLVIHNAEAGDGSQPPALLRRVLDDAGYEPRYISTDADWGSALLDEVDLVVLVGGDGTVARAIRVLGDRKLPVALLPTGTANNLAKTMGIAGDVRDVVRSWRDGVVLPLDVWLAQAPDSREPFVEAVGGGLLATAMARGWELEAPTFILGSEFDRALHMLRIATANEPARAWGVTIDGFDHSGIYIGVEVMNGPHIGPNIPLAPDAQSGDGNLEVVLLQEPDRADLIERFGTLRDALTPAHGALRIVRGQEVRITAPGNVALHLDGDVWHQRLRREMHLEFHHAGAVDVLIGRAEGTGSGAGDSPVNVRTHRGRDVP